MSAANLLADVLKQKTLPRTIYTNIYKGKHCLMYGYAQLWNCETYFFFRLYAALC